MPVIEGEVRVLVVAADPLARAGLATLLENQPGCQVVGQVGGSANLGAKVDVYRPDALVWDVGWGPPTLAPAEQLEELQGVEWPIVALLPDEELAGAVWSAGVRGLLLREVSGERLVAAVAAVVQGLTVLEPELARHLLPVVGLEADAPVADLTPRELEVLQLAAEGLSNKAIALRLSISEHTVKFHINAILGKLGAQSRTEAVVRATRLGLILL